MSLRADALGLWLAASGKTVLIEAPPSPDQPYRVTITPSLEEPPYPASDTTGASLRTASLPAVWNASTAHFARLPGLRVEADPPSGRTYELYLTVENHDPQAHGGFQWRAATDADPIDTVRLMPDTGPSFVDAVVHMDDDSNIPWALPFETLRRATPDEERRYHDHQTRIDPRSGRARE